MLDADLVLSQAKVDQVWSHYEEFLSAAEIPELALALKSRHASARAAGRKVDEAACALAMLALSELGVRTARRERFMRGE